MNDNVLDNYQIHEGTLLLLPAFHIEYQTIVVENDMKLFIRKTPIELISLACLNAGSTYEGRKAAVTYKTNIKRKVPIPIDPQKKIFTFPTHAPEHHQCSWIFPYHVRKIKSNHKYQKEATVIFKNNISYTFPVSPHSLERQLFRASYCILRFTP